MHVIMVCIVRFAQIERGKDARRAGPVAGIPR